MRQIDWKTENLTIIDETLVVELMKIDDFKCPYHDFNYYELLETLFVSNRYLYKKKNYEPLMYWFCHEGIGDYSIKCYNSTLPDDDMIDIIINVYRDKCSELGNTLTIYVHESRLDLCNYLKYFNPVVKYEEPNILFTLFSNFQKKWVECLLNVI